MIPSYIQLWPIIRTSLLQYNGLSSQLLSYLLNFIYEKATSEVAFSIKDQEINLSLKNLLLLILQSFFPECRILIPNLTGSNVYSVTPAFAALHNL